MGKEGIIHGSRTLVMQTDDGQIVEPYSVSAGLDYPGIGPLHAFLAEEKRAEVLAVTDEEALNAAFCLTEMEGIIPALESAHALAVLDVYKRQPSYRFNKFQSNDFPVPPNCLLRVSNKNN